MMKKHFLSLLLVLIPIILIAQENIPEFSPLGAKWYYDSFEVTFEPDTIEDDVPYVLISYDRDTIIDDMSAKVLREVAFDITGGETFYRNIIIRQEGWQILFYADSAFRLLYDYAAPVGHSYQLYIDQWYEDDRNLELTVTVDSVAQVDLNGVQMPAYKTNAFMKEWQFIGWNYFKTGNLRYLLAYDDLLADQIPSALQLRCYEDPEFLLHRRDYACDALFSTSSRSFQKFEDSFTLYPNPASAYLRLENTNNRNISDLLIYDNHGRLVLQPNLRSPKDIDVRSLAMGNYFLVIKADDNFFRTSFSKL